MPIPVPLRPVFLRPLLGLAAVLIPALASAQTTRCDPASAACRNSYGHDDADGPGEVPDTHEREDVLQEGIQRRAADGALAPRDARRAYRQLDDIRHLDAAYRIPDGVLSPQQRRDLIDRLGALGTSLSIDQRLSEARNSR